MFWIGQGEIVSAHAEIEHRGGTYVSGILHKGFGYESVFDAQIDVKVLGSDRRLVTSLTTDFFPRPIPNDYHGTIGRAWFSVRLPFVPLPGSTIQVIYRRTAPNVFGDPAQEGDSQRRADGDGRWFPH